jgi:hypothetical protein
MSGNGMSREEDTPNPQTTHYSAIRWSLWALVTYCMIAVSLTCPALLGQGSITPEGYLDKDLLYKELTEAKLRPFQDATPIVLELGRARAVASGLSQRRIDTWNPWSGAGAPLWAEQGGPFFPTNLIYYLYPHHVTLMAALAARLVVAALGMFFLVLALEFHPLNALFVGALFEYSGILAAELPFASTSATYVLPWALLGAHTLCTKPGPGAVGVAGLALGIALLGGHPSFILLTYLGFGAWLLGEWAHKRPTLNELKALVFLATAVGLIAILTAAAGLLPFLELLVHGQSYKNVDISELVWLKILFTTRQSFFAAMFFPSLVTATRDTPPTIHWWPFAEGASIGLVALLLAIAGSEKLREHWGLILITVLGIGLTLAPIGLEWLHQLPGLRIILPWYCYSLIVVPLCIAAGYGLQIIASASRANLLVVPLAVMLAGVVLFGLVLAAIALFGGSEAFQSLKEEIEDSGLRYVGSDHIRGWKIYVSPVAALVAVGAYVLLCRNYLARAAIVVAVVAMIEAAAIRIPTVIFERSVVLRSGPSEVTTRLQALLSGGYWRFIGVPVEVGYPNTSVLFELRDLRSVSAIPVRRQKEFLELAGPSKAFPTEQYPSTISLPMLSLAAVKYVIYSEHMAARYRSRVNIPSSLKEQEAAGGLIFFENLSALPRFRIVHDVIPVEGERQAFETLRHLLDDSSPAVAPEWARRSVIEGITHDEALLARAETDPSRNFESVRRLSEPDSQTIVLEALLDRPGFVLVADTFYPGWTATVDDVPTVIHPANLLFRAVAVPAGKHTIVMKYGSSWLPIGGALTLIGLLLAAALLVRDRFLNRRRVRGKSMDSLTYPAEATWRDGGGQMYL